MKESDYKDLDQFFNKRLNTDTPADDGWNVPPMSILENSLDAIEVPNIDRKKWILKLLIALVAIIIVTMIYFVSMEVRSINNQIEELKNEQALNSAIKKVESFSIHNSLGTQMNNSLKIEKSDTQIVQDQKLSTEILNSKQPNLKQYLEPQTLQEQKVIANIESQEQPSILSELISIKPANDNQGFSNNGKVHLRSEKSTQNLSIQYIQNSPSLLVRNEEVLSKSILGSTKEPQKDISILVQTGLTFNNYKMNSSSTDYSLSQIQQFNLGTLSSIGIKAQLSDKWSVRTSLNYAKWNNQSMFLQDIQYDKSKMNQSISGSYEYNDMIFVASPSSTLDNQMQFQFRSSDMGDGKPMLNKTIITESYQAIGFSLGIAYDVIKQSRLKLATYVGTSLRMIVVASQHLNTELYDGTDMMGNNYLDRDIKNQLNNMVFSASFGSQLSYGITPKLDLLLNLGYTRDISPINRKNNSQNLGQTYQSSLIFGTGIGYRL